MTLAQTVTSLTLSITSLDRFIRIVKLTSARLAGLNSTEYEVLFSIYYSKQSLSVKDLSREMFLSSQAITKIVKNLLKKGFIHAEKSAKDRRITYITLTEKGQTLIQKDEMHRKAMVRKCIEDISVTDLQYCANLLHKIHENIADNTISELIHLIGIIETIPPIKENKKFGE
ncbi:MAG: MarR family transcriptional regulator [Bacteroidia bacterium]|nr:MarR family transcriptional regulator [Bacteroidia bacterium]